MIKRYVVIVAAAVSIAALLHCSKNDTTSGPPSSRDTTFAGNVQPIFTSSCATSSACHATPGQLGLVLSSGQAYANLVNVRSTEFPVLWRVRPSSTDSSYVVHKIEGTQTVGSRMPPPGPLSAGEIQQIKAWIRKGALNN